MRYAFISRPERQFLGMMSSNRPETAVVKLQVGRVPGTTRADWKVEPLPLTAAEGLAVYDAAPLGHFVGDPAAKIIEECKLLAVVRVTMRPPAA